MSTNSVQSLKNNYKINSQVDLKNFSNQKKSEFIQTQNDYSIDHSRVLIILSGLKAITDPYTDSEGRIIKIWKSHQFGYLAGVLDKYGHLDIVPNQKILNPTNPSETGNTLFNRIEVNNIKKWVFVFDPLKKTIAIWPHLIAEARFKIKDGDPLPEGHIRMRGSPFQNSSREHIVGLFQKEIDKGTIQKTGTNPDNGFGQYIRTKPIFIKDRGTNEQRKLFLKYQIDPRFKGSHLEPNHLDVFLVDEKGKVVKKVRFAYADVSERYGDPKGPNSHLHRKANHTPSTKQFQENVQDRQLTKSYNSNNPDHPIPAKGTSAGSIGGVGSQGDVIEGLFDSIDELFEDEHVFFIPEKYGKNIPFSQDQLRQILRELAIGIYTHGSVPFFSLHFNQKGDLYPIIHPFYENTLVGKVVSMLDNILKGFLNGGTFEESFVYDWLKNQNNNSNNAWDRLIDFEKYCKENLKGKDQSYISLRVLEQATMSTKELNEPAIFRDFTKFNNSFRIIAKQNRFPKEGNLLSVDGDFDVFYTIDFQTVCLSQRI